MLHCTNTHDIAPHHSTSHRPAACTIPLPKHPPSILYTKTRTCKFFFFPFACPYCLHFLPCSPSKMGRNKNKENRSVARRSNGVAAPGNKKRDTGLPTYFKQRKINGLPTKEPRGPARDRVHSKDGNGDDIEMEGEASVNLPASSTKSVRQASDGFVLDKAARDLTLSGKRDSSAKAFMKDVKNVIETSDVILQVLDARDPLGGRSRQTELMAMGSGKKVVLILNKVDLIPTSNLQGWLKYLRNDFPTLAFKASTQQQRGNLKQGKASLSLQDNEKRRATGDGPMSFGSEAVGAASLLQLLKNYARTSAKGSNLKHQLTVGVIGPPNVGKSSLINSLLRTRACAVASTPGWTKNVQGVMLEKGIRLLDCPGVVVAGVGGSGQEGVSMASEEETKMNNAWNVLRNTVKVELIEDPIAPVQALMARVVAEDLSKLYNIDGGFNEGDVHDFLLRVALMRGKLGKGGIADLEGAARIVLHDWNVGRISYCTKVPAVHPSTQTSAVVDAQGSVSDDTPAGTSLVSTLGQAFDLEALLGEADAEALGGNGRGGVGNPLIMARQRVLAGQDEEQQSAIALDEEDDGEEADAETEQDAGLDSILTSSTLGKRARRRGEVDSDDSDDEEAVSAVPLLVASDDDETIPLAPNEYEDRRRQKAEAPSQRQRDLLTVFSPHEIQGMAQRRGDARRAAKKKKKRLERSETGLVDVWNKGLHLPADEHRPLAAPLGLFHVPSPSPQSKGEQEHDEHDEEEL